MSEVINPQHLTPDVVEEYFRLGIRTAFTLSEEPDARLVIDPVRDEIQLLTPAAGSPPEVTAYERISIKRQRPNDATADWYEMTVDSTDMRYEGYVLVESIVDQLRAGASFRHAVSESLEGLKDLLASRSRLTEERITGLIGELLVLSHVIDADGEDAAIAAWLGPLSEEHDFGFGDFDAEVKCTRSEGRAHVIGSDTQLQPEPERPLYLISVQITRAGGASDSFTLPSLIASVRSKLHHASRSFDSAIEGLGWRDRDGDLYGIRYQLRSVPRGYLVDDAFPAITAARLDSVVPQRSLVTRVSYRLDATHLPYAEVPAPLDGFCEDIV
ncbi:PD-(D/E)XK motif protein [Salinibacterium sp. NSLL150]|uniref:PD-(D/E)XK motif protein n=1 Tax=unclassified Salinibacterium TaxID=2632331 RepID=UPI0018CCE5A0|nr:MULTISPECIES: PD-(D/E)XK motif protein [unclassified Salinibacterium]MBH0097615.1 PD-(D/E)XK motif protein [Salinibacterium sp. NSLL35]MBH0100370.1 PD-(D/E)XK motif protein [Salinibacterium sp. NSLL150]MBH0103129.1 PD-(D/E)XK motif protein [Salinibacterium sp. NSLL16]MBH0105890.1 PD-(D/E)XK motif protein [Salinibacterium sp. NSLL17]